MKPSLHNLERLVAQHDPRMVSGALGVVVLLGAAGWYIARRRRPSPEELERRRREHLANHGRLTDGVIVDARTLAGEESHHDLPQVLLYSYQLAGVTYNCAQDVSHLADSVRGYRLDQPVQVRYDPRNPGNSVIVTESWSGLRLSARL